MRVEHARLVPLLEHSLLQLEDVAGARRDPVLVQNALVDARLRTPLWPPSAVQRLFIRALTLLVEAICFID